MLPLRKALSVSGKPVSEHLIMREEIKLSKSSIFLLIGIFLTVIAFAVSYFTSNWLDWQDEMTESKSGK